MKKKEIILIFFLFVFFSLTIAWISGLLSSHPKDMLIITSDGRDYYRLADFFLGGKKVEDELIFLRPPLYPIFLTISVFWNQFIFTSFQLILNFLSVVLVFLTVRNITHSMKWSWCATIALLSIPSFLILPFYALTETLTTFLLCGAMYIFTKWSIMKKPSYLVSYCGLLGLAFLTKPSVSFLYYVSIIHLFFQIKKNRDLATFEKITIVLAGFSAILIQFFYTYVYTGHPTLGTAFSLNLETRFFPAVLGVVQRGSMYFYTDQHTVEAQNLYPTLSAKLHFMGEHLWTSLKTARRILYEEHIKAPSNLIVINPNYLNKFVNTQLSVKINVLILTLLCATWIIQALLQIAKVALKRNVGWSIIASLAGLVLLIGAPLTYWQGDRILVLSMPFFIVSLCLNNDGLNFVVNRTIEKKAVNLE